MSTRSCVILKLRKEDIGKVVKFNKELLPVPLDRWQNKGIDGKVWRDETVKDKCKPVEISDNYIAISCHWDGYPEGVGAALKEHFKDYESVMNLIVGGSCSVIGDKVRHYANRKGDKWEDIVPKQFKTQKDVLEHYTWCECEYAYLFDEKKGWGYKEL
jgi:hypothetical protein